MTGYKRFTERLPNGTCRVKCNEHCENFKDSQERMCDYQECDIAGVSYLAELEDKIESGTLKEIPEDSVVLTREEYEVLKIKEKEKHWLQTCMSVWENGKIDGSKETAREFYNLSEEKGGGVAFYNAVRKLAKQYGVEVE